MTRPNVAAAIVFAQRNGATKQQAIALVCKTLVEAGMAPVEALDYVFGEGTSAELVSDLYDTLRAQAA